MEPDELAQHMDLCRIKAAIHHRKWRTVFTLDELYSDALLGLCQAIQTYDPAKSTATFKTFAEYRIEGAIKDGIRERVGREDRSHGSAKNTLFKAHSLHMETEEGDTVESDIEDPSSVHAFDEAVSELPTMGDLIQYLTKKERQIIKLCYIDDLKLTDAARRMGVSYFKAKFVHDRTLEKLRFFVPKAVYA